jgi:hypothetical protein
VPYISSSDSSESMEHNVPRFIVVSNPNSPVSGFS